MADQTPVKQDTSDPSLNGMLAGLITSAVLFFGARYALPVDQVTATLLGGVLAGILGPLVTALVTRLRAWRPSSVAIQRQVLQEMLDEAQSANPPAIVTGTALTPAAAEALLPHSRASSTTGTEDGLPGRHHQEDR